MCSSGCGIPAAGGNLPLGTVAGAPSSGTLQVGYIPPAAAIVAPVQSPRIPWGWILVAALVILALGRRKRR